MASLGTQNQNDIFYVPNYAPKLGKGKRIVSDGKEDYDTKLLMFFMVFRTLTDVCENESGSSGDAENTQLSH